MRFKATYVPKYFYLRQTRNAALLNKPCICGSVLVQLYHCVRQFPCRWTRPGATEIHGSVINRCWNSLSRSVSRGRCKTPWNVHVVYWTSDKNAARLRADRGFPLALSQGIFKCLPTVVPGFPIDQNQISPYNISMQCQVHSKATDSNKGAMDMALHHLGGHRFYPQMFRQPAGEVRKHPTKHS